MAQNPPPADSLTRINPRFGVVDGFVNTAEASAVGAGWTRVFFRWDVVQPGGLSDWKPANVPDPLLNAEVEAGREVVGVLIGTPGWATTSKTSTAVPPTEIWGQFVHKLATQYKGRVNHWVIWNQPDVTDPASPNYTWDGTEEDYYRLLKEAYFKIKAVDPAMQVHLAGLTYTWDQQQGNRQYLERLLEIIANDPEAAANNYFFDVVSYHVYYDPLQTLQILTDVRAILTTKGLDNKPVWIDETNAPPSEDYIEPPLGPPVFKVSLEEQSAFVVQAFALALAGGADRVAFNKLRNDVNYAGAVVPYGLLRSDESRRPAFSAFRTVSTYFADAHRAEWQKLGDVMAVTLDRAGQTTTVLWNTGRTAVDFKLSAISSQALLVNDQGASQTIDAVNGFYTVDLPSALCANGDYCFIGGAPRLIIESGLPSQRAALLPPASPPALPSDTPVPAPTPAPPTAAPTLTPEQSGEQITQITPAPSPTINAPPAELPETSTETVPPPADILPNPDVDPFAADTIQVDDLSSVPTVVPPVTVRTILRPERLLWLFIIGLIVFTVAYGVQITIWRRFKK